MVSLVSSQLGYSNPNLPKIDYIAPTISFNNNTGAVNTSDFWDLLDTPNDISAGDLGDGDFGAENILTTGTAKATKVGAGVTPTYLFDATGSHLGMRLHRNSATAGYSVWGDWALENDASEVTTYGQVRGVIQTNTDGSENGKLSLYAMDGGTLKEKAYVNETGFYSATGRIDRLGCGTSATATDLVTLSHSNTAILKATNTANSDAYSGAGFQFFSNNGSAMIDGGRLGFLTFGASYDDSGNTYNSVAISSYAEGDWGGVGGRPAGFQFETTPVGGSTRKTRMIIGSDGNVNVTGNLTIDKNLIVQGCIQYNCSDSCITLGSCI